MPTDTLETRCVEVAELVREFGLEDTRELYRGNSSYDIPVSIAALAVARAEGRTNCPEYRALYRTIKNALA